MSEIVEIDGVKYKITHTECRYCSSDGTINFPDGRICDECGGEHDLINLEETSK